MHPPPTPLLADDVAASDGEPDEVAEADTVPSEAPGEAEAASLCSDPLARGDAETRAEPDAAAVGVAESEETKAK